MSSSELTSSKVTDTDTDAAPASESAAQASSLSHHDGKPGKWQKVQVSELTRVYVEPEPERKPSNADTQAKPKVTLQRRQELENLIKSNPTNADIFLELAAIYRAEDKPSEAKRVLKQACEIFADEEELVWQLEEAVLARSLQQLREVTELASRLNTAEAERELRRSQQDWALRRMEICDARLQRDSSQKHLIVPLGEAMYDAEKYQQAYERLGAALSDSALSPGAHLIRGKCLLALQRDIDAMVEFRACALSRAVVAPVRIRILALRALCETSERLGITLMAKKYSEHLKVAEKQLAKSEARDAQ